MIQEAYDLLCTLPETNSSPMKTPFFPGFHTIKMVDFPASYVSLPECKC